MMMQRGSITGRGATWQQGCDQLERLKTVCCSRSTARVTTGQRVSLNSIESAVQESRDGLTYWVYEHLSQVIITKSNNALYITILLPLRQGGCQSRGFTCLQDLTPLIHTCAGFS